MIRWRERVCVALAAGLAFWSAASAAQEGGAWPARTIQVVVPYPPGTGADILARILGPKLAERWKVGVVTDNRAGAQGNIGTDHVSGNPRPTATRCFARRPRSAPILRSIESCRSTR